MDNKQIAQKIKYLAKDSNVSVAQLLKDCGVNKSFIYDLEKRNSSPSVETIQKVADYFDMPLERFLGTEEYDGYILPEFNGDVRKQIAFEKAVEQDALSEKEYLSTVQPAYELTEEEQNLIISFKLLNRTGQQKAIDYINDLSENEKYQQGNKKGLLNCEMAKDIG